MLHEEDDANFQIKQKEQWKMHSKQTYIYL